MPSSRSAEPGRPATSSAGGRQVSDGFVAVGVVLTSFGLRGEIKVEPLTDFPERFAPGERLWLAGTERRVERSRRQNRVVFLKLEGIESPEAIAPLRGCFLELPEAARAALEPGAYYQSDIIGLAVETTSGAPLGRVVEFLPTGANDVLVVRGEQGESLIPMIEDVVREVDVAGGRLVIEPVAGLLSEPREPRPPRVPPEPRWRRRRAALRSAAANDPPPPPDLQRT